MATDDTDALFLARSSPAGFAHVCSGGLWVPYEHLILLNDYLLRVASGEITRLIVTMPPQHGKSELISRYFPAWYLGTFPDRKILFGSYQAAYAQSWGRKARGELEQYGPSVFGVNVAEDSNRQDWWFTEKGGYMASDGAGGAFTGKGAHLIIIDDPIKGYEQAASELIREKTWDWWVATLRSRLQKINAVVVVQTRWHEDDLAGRLLSKSGDDWTLLNLPAIAEADDQLGRAVGDVLCSELHDREQLDAYRKENVYWWNALYQQRPAPPEGFLFKTSDFRHWRAESTHMGATETVWYLLPRDDGTTGRVDAGRVTVFQVVDVAISEKETADYTVIGTFCRTPEGDLIVLDIERRHFEQQQTIEFLAASNNAHGRVPMWIERFGAGRNPLARLASMGHPVMEIPAVAGAQADKLTRAFEAISRYQQHRIFHPYGKEWLGEFEHELTSFPNATHDDQVDVISYAARLLPLMGMAVKRDLQRNVARPVMAGIMSEQF